MLYNDIGKFARRFLPEGLFSKISKKNGEGANRGLPFFICAVLATFALTCLIGCEPPEDLDLKNFRAALFDLHRDDGFLSKENIDSLKKQALKAESPKFKALKEPSGQIHVNSFADFICKELEKEGIALSKQNVTDPISEHFNVNFFIKNSGNMYGYINPKSNFQTALFGLLADLKLASKFTDSLTLHYVNTTITHQVLYNHDKVLQNYIQKIKPDEFAKLGREKGGDPGETDFDKIFEQVLKKVDKNSIAILAADFVLSPGKGVNTDDYLNLHGESIRIKFTQKIAGQDLAVLVLKMESYFKGRYANKKSIDVGEITVQKRPYYIWFIGSPLHIAKIAQNKQAFVALKNNGYTGDMMVLDFFGAERQPEFKVAASDKYIYSKKERKIKAKRTKDKFSFSLEANFNDPFRDSVFFANPANYKVSNNSYVLSVKQPPRDKKFKHRLVLDADQIAKGELKITAVDKIPDWIDNSNSTDDVNIKRDVSEQSKTYGFKRLIEGVYLAFYPNAPIKEPHVLQTINLNIQLED